jgi:sugar phosphate isomerase/epimerase
MKTILPLLAVGLLLGFAFPGAETTDSKAGIGPSFKGPVGLQLWSLRDQFAEDVPGTLKMVQDMGFRYVELAGTYGLSPAEFRKKLDAHGLKPISAHFSYEQFRDNPEAVAAEAKVLGIEYAGLAWIPHQGTFNEQTAREAIEVFNRAGKILAAHGIKFFYHQHGYEFHPHGDGTLMDLMIRETNPEHVRFQMDTFWVVHPGHDPVELLKRYGNRWELVHLKDMKKGLPTGDLSGQADSGSDVALGTGQMDMPAILKAAQAAGVKYYFIEDESPDAPEQIPQSLRFLEQVRF